MRPFTKFVLFLLDEIVLVLVVLIILFMINISFEIFIVLVFILFGIVVFVSYVFLPQLKQPITGREGLIGKKAVALDSFEHHGFVLIRGERWNAIAEKFPVKKGEDVIVSDVDGLTLIVKKINTGK